MRPFTRVAVLGLGLMGGSLARALCGLSRLPDVVGWSPDPRETARAHSDGALSEAAPHWRDAVAGADLIVLAAPLEGAMELLRGVADHVPDDAIVTDVVSLKAPLHAAATDCGLERGFVGSHPMCGGEGSGYGASRSDLYRDARIWVTRGAGGPELEARVRAFWTELGARPAPIEPEAHDRLMALASHLPQLTANSLARVLESFGVGPEQLGPGGRDMTRLASSNPDMWLDLLAWAPEELPEALRALSRELAAAAQALDEGDAGHIEDVMDRTRAWRADS